MSLIRIDSIEMPSYDLRVYAEEGDPECLLCDEMREPISVARIFIDGSTAIVSTALGDMSSNKAWADFDRKMIEMGIDTVFWERHKNGQVLIKKRRIKKRD